MPTFTTLIQRTPSFFMAAAFFIATFSTEALACRCKSPKSVTEAFAKSDAVFLGQVSGNDLNNSHRRITLKVTRWWKGGDSPEVVLHTQASTASCGINLTKGENFLVYAELDSKKKILRTTSCNRTRPEKIAEAAGDFKELGEGKSP